MPGSPGRKNQSSALVTFILIFIVLVVVAKDVRWIAYNPWILILVAAGAAAWVMSKRPPRRRRWPNSREGRAGRQPQHASAPRSNDFADLYLLLGVPPDATQEELAAARRRQLQYWHPDKKNNDDALNRSQALNDAYDTLRDPVKRAAYDRRWRDHAARNG